MSFRTVGRYADVGHYDIAAKPAPRKQQVTRFLAKERHRKVRGRGGAQNHSGRAINAAGNIYCASRYPTCFERLDERKSFAVQRPRQTRTENRVDHDTGAFKDLGRERRDSRRSRDRRRGPPHRSAFRENRAEQASPANLQPQDVARRRSRRRRFFLARIARSPAASAIVPRPPPRPRCQPPP